MAGISAADKVLGSLQPQRRESVLDVADRQSPLWIKLKAYMDARVNKLRAKNDGPLNEEKTTLLRGHIQELKFLMALDNPAPLIEAEDPLFKD